MGKLEIFICNLFFIFYIVTYALQLYFTIWTSSFCLLLYITILIFLIFSLFNIIIYIFFSYNIKFIIKHSKYYVFSYWFMKNQKFIFFYVIYLLRFINLYNLWNYDNFIKNCPFSLSSDLKFFNDSFYEKRRCELYDINMNSRYKYQYICSYNASEYFKNDNKKDGLDKIICIPKEHNIDNNEIIDKFNEIYECKDNNDTNLFYCSRIDKPEKDIYIKEKFCNQEKKVPFFVDLFVYLLDIFRFILNFLLTRLKEELKNRINYMMRILEEQLNSLIDDGDKDTEYDESNLDNEPFNEEEDKNIIMENHIVYNVDFNIKEFIKNEEKQKLD